MSVGNQYGANIDHLAVHVDEACADPAIIGAIAIELAGDDLAAQQSLHEGGRVAAIPVGGFGRIDAIQADGRSRHDDRVRVPDMSRPGNLSSNGLGALTKESKGDRKKQTEQDGAFLDRLGAIDSYPEMRRFLSLISDM